MAGQYKAKERTIGEMLMLSVPLRVPPWQRSYSWRTQEVAEFWEDLVRFSDRYPNDNIIGKEYFLGSVVTVDKASYLEVLDGQQRLATSTIMLSALRDVAATYDPDAGRDIGNDYIAKRDRAASTTRYKLKLNNYDWKFFQEAIQEPGGQAGLGTLSSHKLIAKAREYLLKQARLRFDAAGGGKKGYLETERLLKVLIHHASVVEVTSQNEDAAAAVFETLNDRGIGLSTPDLLRNFLLLKTRSVGARNEIVELWEEVFRLGGNGGSVEDFLRHYWISTHGDIKAKALYREIKSEIEDRETNALTLSKKLAKAADDYEAILAADAKDRSLRLALEGAQVLNAKVLLPALLSARAVGRQTAQASFAPLLVSTFVRHTLIGGLAGVELESFVFELAVELRTEKNFKSAVRRLREFAPPDRDFKKAFATAQVGRVKSARYLLTAIEHYQRETGEVRVEDPDMVHVEHIYPQNPRAGKKWRKHDEFINRLGNLTLLGKRLNQSARNASFTTKKKKAYVDSDIEITEQLMAYGRWTTTEIEKRQASLATAAVKIWTV